MVRETKVLIITCVICLAALVGASKYDERYYSALPTEKKARIAQVMSELEQAPPKSIIIENSGRLYYVVAPYVKGARSMYVKWYPTQADTTEYILMSYRQKAKIDRVIAPGHPEHGRFEFRFFNGE